MATAIDPDRTLSELRGIIGDVRAHRRVTPEQIERMAMLADDLDHWLSHGGYLPGAWRNGGQ